jgi:hypothetical protein
MHILFMNIYEYIANIILDPEYPIIAFFVQVRNYLNRWLYYAQLAPRRIDILKISLEPTFRISAN